VEVDHQTKVSYGAINAFPISVGEYAGAEAADVLRCDSVGVVENNVNKIRTTLIISKKKAIVVQLNNRRKLTVALPGLTRIVLQIKIGAKIEP